MSKWLNPGMYGASLTGVWIDEYLELADDLAQAIEADNPDTLCSAIAALDVKPYI